MSLPAEFEVWSDPVEEAEIWLSAAVRMDRSGLDPAEAKALLSAPEIVVLRLPHATIQAIWDAAAVQCESVRLDVIEEALRRSQAFTDRSFARLRKPFRKCTHFAPKQRRLTMRRPSDLRFTISPDGGDLEAALADARTLIGDAYR